LKKKSQPLKEFISHKKNELFDDSSTKPWIPKIRIQDPI